MRSNNSKVTRFLLRRNLFIGVIVFLITFFSIPFWGLSQLPSQKEIIFQQYSVQEQPTALTRMLNTAFNNSMLDLEAMVLLYSALGFLCAITLMRHLFSRRQGMLHAALPQRRERDFLQRCLAYVAFGFVPIVLNFLLYLLIVAANGLLPYVAWNTLLGKFGLLLFIGLHGFAVGMLSSVLTGTYWAAALAGIVLTLSSWVVIQCWCSIASLCLQTMTSEGINQLITLFSPIYALYKGFYQPQEFVWWPCAAVVLVVLALSFLLYRVRKTEAAEHTLAFGWLHGVMGFVLPLVGGSVMGVIFNLSFETNASLVVGLLLGAALTYWVCRMVFNQRFCGIREQWYLLAAAAAVLICSFAALCTDVFGYDHYMPEREKLTAIVVQSLNFDADAKMTLTSPETLDAAYEWCVLMRDEADGYVGETDYCYGNVQIGYQMGNRTVYRRYPNQSARNEGQSLLKTIIESDDYKQSLIQEYHLNAGDVNRIYLYGEAAALIDGSSAMYDKFGVLPSYMTLEEEADQPKIKEWLAALKQDILERTFEEKQQDALFTLDVSGGNDEERVYYKTLEIYPGDEHFLKAVFGEKAEAIVDYATGGFAADEDIVVLKAAYPVSRAQRMNAGVSCEPQSIEQASSPEEAVAWVRAAQQPSASDRYYMPDHEDERYCQLYVYRLSDVERYGTIYSYSIPEDCIQYITRDEIPYMTVLNMIDQ